MSILYVHLRKEILDFYKRVVKQVKISMCLELGPNTISRII